MSANVVLPVLLLLAVLTLYVLLPLISNYGMYPH